MEGYPYRKIDINCDLGEGMGREAEILPLIGSCSVACGGHTGDPHSMEATIQGAQRHRVKVGAHPSFPDRDHFGRRSMAMGKADLMASIREQLAAFDRALARCGAKLHHIKAHGALYNQTVGDESLARTYLEALKAYRNRALLYVPYGSVIAALARDQGFGIWFEAFADRQYRADLSLLPRGERDALIEEPPKVLEHLLPMVREGRVRTVEGGIRKLRVDTLCVHGDNPRVSEILMYLSRELPNNQVQPTK